MSFLSDRLLPHVNSVRPVHHVHYPISVSSPYTKSISPREIPVLHGPPPKVLAAAISLRESVPLSRQVIKAVGCLSRDHSSLTFFVGSTINMQLLPCFDFIQSSLYGTMPEPSSALQYARSHFHYRTSFSCLSAKGSSPDSLICDFHQEFHFISNPQPSFSPESGVYGSKDNTASQQPSSFPATSFLILPVTMTMANDQSATLMPYIVLTYSTHVLVQANVFVLIIYF